MLSLPLVLKLESQFQPEREDDERHYTSTDVHCQNSTVVTIILIILVVLGNPKTTDFRTRKKTSFELIASIAWHHTFEKQLLRGDVLFWNNAVQRLSGTNFSQASKPGAILQSTPPRTSHEFTKSFSLVLFFPFGEIQSSLGSPLFVPNRPEMEDKVMLSKQIFYSDKPYQLRLRFRWNRVDALSCLLPLVPHSLCCAPAKSDLQNPLLVTKI